MSSRRAVAIDLVAVAAVGVAACVGAHDTARMTAVVAATHAARLAVWSRLRPAERPLPMWAEVAFTALCALLGGFNDWNTVDRHHVYSYGVPSDLAPLSSIPLWMLAYWGLILRLVATLGMFEELGEPGRPGALRGTRAAHPWLRVGLLLAMVAITRQSIYRYWADPLWSWLPFAAALALHALLFPWGRREKRLALIAATVGPVAEMLLIRAGLHRYALGWLFGVPVWIALWWVLATLLWGELSRLVPGLVERVGRRPAPGCGRAGDTESTSTAAKPRVRGVARAPRSDP